MRRSLVQSLLMYVFNAAAIFSAHAASLDRLVIGSPSPTALIEMLRRTDEWPTARSKVSSILFADHVAAQWSDQDLRTIFDRMRQLGISAEFEVGALKEWAKDSRNAAARELPMWRKLLTAGAPLTEISFDEPLASSRKKHATDEWAADQVAEFVSIVRREVPGVLVGDIEPYRFFSIADHRRWLDLVDGKVKQRGIQGLDFYRLDVDWAAFHGARGNWSEVKQIESDIHARSMAFSLIYWAAPYPARYGNSQNDAAWYQLVMEQGRDYKSAGGSPDQYVLENWVMRPTRVIPENEDNSTTRLIRDFSSEFISVQSTRH